MSEKLLKSALRNEIDVNILKSWLIGQDVKFESDCTPQEFITYFITYLRDETSRFLQSSVPVVVQPTTKVVKTNVTPNRRRISTSFTKSFNNVSSDANNSLHSSTPNKKSNQSHSDTFLNSSNDNSRSQKCFLLDEKNFPTFDSFISDSLYSKENIYANKNKKKKKSGRPSQSPNKSLDEKSPEIIVNNKDNKVLTNRRIKPTILTEHSPKPAIVSSNSFSFTEDLDGTENVSAWQRSVLRDEKEKIAAKTSDMIITAPKYTTNKSYVKPNLDSVTNVIQLNILVQIYTILLNNNLILNLSSELHFILTLLLSNSENNDSEIHLFNSIHNLIYFSANILAKQCLILRLLNRTTLKLLCENTRLLEFVPMFVNELSDAYNLKVEISNDTIYTAEQMTFISDTDNRDNFPNDVSFHMFRKQRDLFYEILQMWDSNHNQPGWSFMLSLGNKIKVLLSMHQDPINYFHLARLFKSQLLSSGAKNTVDDDLEKDMNLLDVSADKLNKLKNRLVTKESAQNYSEFPNQQEFYRDFINCTQNNYMFIKHLENILADRIVSMEDNFYSEENETDDTFDSVVSRNNYISFIKSSKLLAKFLGYIEALPYKSDIVPTGIVLKTLISARKQSVPILDVDKRFTNSLTKGSILLTIPWLVEYLGQLDSVSLQLPAFENLIRQLFKIYFATDMRNCFSESCVLVRMSLGWLFETKNFPRHLFYSFMAENVALDFRIVEKLNAYDFVNEEVLYVCLPQLLGLKTLLSTGSAPVCMRYIRPVTSIVTNLEAQKQREQKQLEEVFFHGSPESMKRLVDFISERVASATIKMIRRVHIDYHKNVAMENFQKYIKENNPEDLEHYEKFVRLAMQEAKVIAEKEYNEMKIKCVDDVKKIAKERCEKSIPALLADDVHTLTAVTCVSITTKKAVDRSFQWIDQTINIAQFMDPLTKELSKVEDDAKSKESDHVSHYLTIQEYSTVKLMTQNTQFIYTANETPELLTQESLNAALEYTEGTLSARNDLSTTTKDTICVQIINIAIALILNRPQMFMENCSRIIDCLENFTKEERKKEAKNGKNKTLNVINNRNVYLFCEGPDSTQSWQAYKVFILALLRRNVLKPASFEEQVLKLFQLDFPEDVLNILVINLREVVEDYTSSKGSENKLVKAVACITNFLMTEDFD